jgi:hypothetical protein
VSRLPVSLPTRRIWLFGGVAGAVGGAADAVGTVRGVAATGVDDAVDAIVGAVAVCWWKSGPKGGRRHNSLPSLTFARLLLLLVRGEETLKLNRTIKETRKYSADRRPKD